MSGTPALIVLYDTDAVEVRCSDGSRLELSPCGATMIYQPALRRGDHPRQGVSSRVHKRTCFVTSDHKKLVLQTLDFRNRFAVRPYLCEELLNKDDVLTLYASVDSIRWPDSTDDAHVQILADGSKKITSLDDFANLVVSPHGQDFSISYLSRVSFDDKGKESSSQQFLQSSNVSYCLSRNKTEMSLTGHGNGSKLSAENINGAVVQPFHVLSIEDQQRATSTSARPAPSLTENTNLVPNLHTNIEAGVQSKRYSFEDADEILSNSELDKTLTEEVAPIGKENDNIDNCSGIVPLHPHPNHDESGMIPGSPVAHDISSISRSSTPDGLRTTIDSDATLIQDHNEVDPVPPCQKMTHKLHRHSSPTHCSSPFDVINEFSFEVGGGQSGKHYAPSLDGSYLENDNRRYSPVGHDGMDVESGYNVHQKRMPVEESDKNNIPDIAPRIPNPAEPIKFDNVNISLHETKTQATLVSAPSSIGAKITQEHIRGNVPSDAKTVQTSIYHPRNELTKQTIRCEPAGFSSDNHQIVKDVQTFPETSTTNAYGEAGQVDQVSAETPKHSPHRFSRAIQDNEIVNLPSEEEFQSFNSRIHSRSHAGLANSQQESLSKCSQSQHSPRPVSSVVESDSEEDSACRKKYVWVTTHASRNCCPKEWTHPLMLALKAQSKNGEKKARQRKDSKEKFKRSIVPKPLPLTCQFQHKHRMASHGNRDDEDRRTGEDSIISSIGEFQQGRLKVVVSEGIIYRLISCNGMTVVEIYPGDGTVLVSQGVKAIFFTHFIPRTNVLEERTYSLKSLPPGCAKGRHSIEKMMKTANRLVQICLNWDKRCGKGKPPCWQKEIVAVVAPLSSSLLEECCVNGLGRFSAFTNGRVRILFDDRTALDTVADFKPRLGKMVEMHPNALYTSDSGASTARLLVTSGNYITVEMNKPGPYAKYVCAAKEWIAWVNASQTERQEFYKQQNQPHIIQQAAELELKKIFCFNYILENTAGLSTQTNQDIEAVTTTSTNNHPKEHRGSNSSNDNKPPTHFVTHSTAFQNHTVPSTHLHHNRHHLPTSDPITSFQKSNNKMIVPPPHFHLSSIHQATPPTHPSYYIPPPSQYKPHNPTSSTPLHPPTSSLQHTPLPYNTPPPPSTIHFNTHQNTPHIPVFSNVQHTISHQNTHHTKPLLGRSQHEDRCADTTMGFQSVRSALARTSSLINDIEMFLEDTKS